MEFSMAERLKILKKIKKDPTKKAEAIKKFDDQINEILDKQDEAKEALEETLEMIDEMISDDKELIDDIDNQLYDLKEEDPDYEKRCTFLIEKRREIKKDILNLKKERMSAETEYERKANQVASNLKGLVECRMILEKPKEAPKWAERIPGELLRGVATAGLMFLGWGIKTAIENRGYGDRNTNFFFDSAGKWFH